MKKDANDKIPENFDFDEEVARLMVEYDVIIVAEWDESIFDEIEFEDSNEGDHNPTPNEGNQITYSPIAHRSLVL
ncbi:uncharacterized protein Dere_GG26790 [Drosophila erecta]|uniref:Uncharacterized protein n=2 Tax=Drosophila erecta TaxID=7220 RepID=A0A0Q5T5J6_DROER|nr:uncharacterized protein Dere_GG26790 [Drosophila erecta]